MDEWRYFYKYIGLKSDSTIRTDFLENGRFRFTQPNQLNDPFEVNPRILVEAYAAEDREFARKIYLADGFPSARLERLVDRLQTLPRGRITPERYPGISYPEGIHSMDELDTRDTKILLNALLKHVNQTYGIFCLSTSRENLLMWSLYADSHKGMVVGFDGNHPFFSNAPDFYPVEYLENRVPLSSNNGLLRLAGETFLVKSEYKNLPIRLFLRKHPDWSRELEWRMIRKLDEASERRPAEPPIYLFEIPPEAIRVILLGAQISDQNKDRVHRAVLSSGKWRHLQILQARLSTSSFGLEFSLVQI